VYVYILKYLVVILKHRLCLVLHIYATIAIFIYSSMCFASSYIFVFLLVVVDEVVPVSRVRLRYHFTASPLGHKYWRCCVNSEQYDTEAGFDRRNKRERSNQGRRATHPGSPLCVRYINTAIKWRHVFGITARADWLLITNAPSSSGLSRGTCWSADYGRWQTTRFLLDFRWTHALPRVGE